MPRDEWKRENDRIAARKRTSRSKARHKRSLKHKQTEVERARLQSPTAILWFGKYKKLTLREVFQKDPSYLTWLANCKPKGWKMEVLVAYLRTSPNLANRRSARHTGGDEAPAITKMAEGKRQTDPNTSRTVNTRPCAANDGWESVFHRLPTETSGS